MKATLLGLFAFCLCSNAATLGYNLDFIVDNRAGFPYPVSANTPVVRVVNTGDRDLTRMTITIGDLTKNFDFIDAVKTSPGTLVTAQNLNKDNNDGIRADTLDLSFSGLTTGRSVMFQTDVDPDLGTAWTENFTAAMFNRSVATFYFADGNIRSRTLEAVNAVNRTYSYSYSQDTPEPATMAIAGAALLGIGLLRRRSRSVSAN
jgi:hypothetical protein